MMMKQIKYNRTVEKFIEMLYSLSQTRDMNETVYWYDYIDEVPLLYLSVEYVIIIRYDTIKLFNKDFGLSCYEIATIINNLIGGDDYRISVLDDVNTFYKVENNKLIQC